MDTEIDDRTRDFLLLNIYVLSQHGYIEQAATLAEALFELGDGSAEVVLARAVLAFFRKDWRAALIALDELDRIDPIERFGQYRLNDRQRMRRYLKARCLHETGERTRARDAVDSYLRHGIESGEDE